MPRFFRSGACPFDLKPGTCTSGTCPLSYDDIYQKRVSELLRRVSAGRFGGAALLRSLP